MTSTQKKYFFAVYTHGNIAKAAEELHVSRPVISRALSDIEKSLGIELFVRTSSGIVPTEQCEVYINMLRSFDKTHDHILEKLRDPNFVSEVSALRIGILHAGSSWFYPVIYAPFHEMYPNVTVRLEGVRNEDAAELILNGHLDIAIAHMPCEEVPLISSLHLYTTQWMLCSPKNSTKMGASGVAISNCTKLPMSVLDSLPPPFCEYVNIVLSTNDPEMIRTSVTNGYSYSILPLEVCVNWDDVVIIPFEPAQVQHIHLFWNNAVTHNPAFNNFISVAKGINFEPLVGI